MRGISNEKNGKGGEKDNIQHRRRLFGIFVKLPGLQGAFSLPRCALDGQNAQLSCHSQCLPMNPLKENEKKKRKREKGKKGENMTQKRQLDFDEKQSGHLIKKQFV